MVVILKLLQPFPYCDFFAVNMLLHVVTFDLLTLYFHHISVAFKPLLIFLEFCLIQLQTEQNKYTHTFP